MSSEDLERLHNIWIKFLNTKNTKEGESWLDAFLARYLTLFCYNDIPPNHEFSFQYKYSANVLVHQLLTDVFQLCEEIEKETSSLENENEVSAKYFQKYLLEGRGWKILWTLDKIGVQHLMHLKELIVVLISQMPVLLTLPVYSSVIPECLERKPKHLDLNACFFLSNRLTNMSKCVDLRKPEVYVFLKRNFRGKKLAHRKRTKSVTKSSSSSSEEQDVMIDHCYIPASQLKSLLKVKTGTNNTDSSSDSSESSHVFIHSDSSIASNVNDFQSYSISVIDYIAFNLNIFQECVLLDAKFKDIKACTSPSVLEFTFRLLKELHTNKYKFSGWPVVAIQDLKTRVLELLFLSSSVTRVTFGYDDYSPSASEIISSLFVISEEILSLPHRHSLHINDILFVSHTLKGCLMLVLNVIETCSGDYAKIICITRTFSSSVDICCSLFPLLEKQITIDCENELKMVISLVKSIVTTLKILRISATYSSLDKCDIKDYIHHHNDIFGPPVSHNIINKDPTCCIATMSCLLLKFFKVSCYPKTSNDILKHLKMSGICCCVSPSFMLKTLFDGYAKRDSETQKLVLIILGKHLFPQLGLVTKCQRRCNCCSKYLHASEFSSVDRTLAYLLPGIDRQMLQSNSENIDSFNLIFNIYNDLLNLSEGETLENISRHLIEVFSICIIEFKIQICIRVIFPQLLHLNINPGEPANSLLNIKIKCFLSVLPHIFPNTALYTVFVKLKGIPIIFSFLLYTEFRDLALNVIKILIYSENEYGSNVDKNSGLYSFPSCRTFCNFLSDQTETFIQKLNLILKLSLTYAELLLMNEDSSCLKTVEKTESTITVVDELPECVTFICDIWSLFNELVLNNKLIPLGNKLKEILTSGYNLLILLLQNLATILRLKVVVENQKIEKVLLLLQNLILILVNQEKKIHDKQSVLDVLRYNLKLHAPNCVKYQKMLFCLILKCSFWSSTFISPVRGLDEVDIYLEKEILDSISSSDKDDTEASANGDSYAGDSEGSWGSTAAEVIKDRFHNENFIKHGEFVKMLCELVSDLQVENSVEWISTALHFMNILVKLCQDCSENKSVLCNHEIPPLLLDIFSNSLNMNHKNIREFQTATMDLFVILTESTMKVDYIKRMIDFFKISDSPVDILLQSFNKMVDQIIHSASWYITFPCVRASNFGFSRVKKQLKTVYSVYKQYGSLENVISAWSSAAIVFPLTEDTKWNAINKGFNLTLSLKLNQISNICQNEKQPENIFEFEKVYPSANSSEKNSLLHILSIGSDKLLIEFWCQKYNGNLVIRISSYMNGEVICLAEGMCAALFQFNMWHHVAICYSEEVEKSVFASKIHITVDGCKERNVVLKYQRPIKSLNKCHLLLGDCVPVFQEASSPCSYSIANVCLFKDNVLTKDVLYYLSHCGPDICGITRCAIEDPTKFVLKNKNFHSMFSPSNLDLIIGNKIPNFDPLQNAVLCSFDAKNPKTYLVYPGAPRGFFPLHFPARGKSRLSGFDEWPYQKQPLEFPSLLLGAVRSYQYCGVEYALQNAGGIRIFLFLFANVLENFASEENLLAALSIILKLLNKSATFVEDFTRIKGYELLIQMIANTKCCISGDYLQVFMQNCMVYAYPDKEIFPNCELPAVENLTIIRNTSIFKLMFKSLAFAPQAPPSVTTGLFSVLDLLLNPKHSNLNINGEQLMSIDILIILMWLLKRNIILFDKNYLPPAVMKMIPIIIESLLIYKFDVNILKNVICLLLLLHNPSSTYVCHSRSSFFFLTPRDKNIDFKASGLMKTSFWSVGNDVNDSFTNPHVSALRRTSSFSGADLTKEKQSFKKSKSLNHLTHDLQSDTDKNDWKSDVFYDFNSDETDKMGHLKFEAKYSSSEVNFNQNKSSELTTGLLKLIYNFITSENTSHSQPLLDIIKPEIFIVLAYTENSEICAAVIKVINAYLKLSGEDKQSEFLTMKGFHLLANQLYQSSADREIVDACFSIIFDCSLSEVDMFAMSENVSAPSFQVLAWVPVLALLPNTYSDEELCENIITVLSKFLHFGTNIIIELLENGLIVSLINLILKFCLSPELVSDEALDNSPIVKKVGHLLKYIAEDLCSSKFSKGFICFGDVLHMFSAWEKICHDKYGSESLCVTSLRNCQCIMYEVVVDFSELYNLSNQDSQKYPDELSVWDVVIGLQSSFGSFTPMAVPQSMFSVQTPIHSAVEAKEFDRPLSADAEKWVNEVPINDIIERFLLLIEAAADFFVFKDHNVKIGFAEKEFFKTFFRFIVENIYFLLDKNWKFVKSKTTAVLFALRDTLKKQLGRILVSSVTPSQDIYIKSCVVEILFVHPFVAKILQYALNSIAKVGAFLVFLYDLQAEPLSKFQKQCFSLFSVVKHLLENSQYISILNNKETMENVRVSWLSLWNEDRCKWLTICAKKNEKTFQKMEFLVQHVSTMALYVTQQVFEVQNTERKLLIEELKTKYYEEACERMIWLELCEQMTHERAVWHMKDYYPFSWEIDPTEGPARVRKRLRRCHIQMHPRFFQPDYADALSNLKKEAPFVNLLTHQNEYPDSAVVLHRLFRDEQIKFTCPCMIVTAFEETAIEILIGAYCIHIIGENTSSQYPNCPISESWTFDSIHEIIPRRHELLNNAFEIFLKNGLTYMIAFHSEKDFNIVWKQLKGQGLPCKTNIDPLAITQLWRDGTLTNYEYLVHLNKLAGRTFNDLMQYPVFPFILSDYVSFFLNIQDPSSFRNLSKPIAVQLERKEEYYRNMYKMLSEQAEFDSSLPYIGPYHYGSHYSNSGTVLHYLIRLLPYTYGFISYQDRNFDCADRTFHNLNTSWELVTERSSSDVKELIPEFFFFPEFLRNKNGFDFGVTQAGIRVNDVILPPWCKQDARLFILVHRQALESEIVSNNLHAWIDLIFGYKQTGEAAINALNVFHPSTYFGMDRNKYSDPLKRNAFRTMIRTLGNTPQQLFSTPHPMIPLTLANFDSADEKENLIEVIDTVQGLRWGTYLGSPSTGTPNLVWCRTQSIVLGSFLPLLDNCVFAVGENVCLLLNHRKDSGSGISRATYIMSAALVSWNHSDGIVRIKLCRDQPSLPLLRSSHLDPICLCASVPDCVYLFVAHSSGIINVYNLELNASELIVKEKKPRVQLNGHSATITSICICKDFSIVASASLDKTVILWDLNKLCYVRTLSCNEGLVSLVKVSDTLGDVASVCIAENNAGSVLKVHTINGDVVGTVPVLEKITALCYSTAPEGLNVNVIATGLDNGVIHLYSSWDIKLVRIIECARFILPIRCISFSNENLHLYASNEDGTVSVWEKPSRGLNSVPRLLVLT